MFSFHQDDEFVVYSMDQQRISYLVEFTQEGDDVYHVSLPLVEPEEIDMDTDIVEIVGELMDFQILLILCLSSIFGDYMLLWPHFVVPEIN